MSPEVAMPDLSSDGPFFLIAGPCVVEGEQTALTHARALKEMADERELPFIYKSSYDKANRTSVHSFRGPGMEEGFAPSAKAHNTPPSAS